jgi:hypothetical protein
MPGPRAIKKVIMDHNISGNVNPALNQNSMPHKFMARRQQRTRTVIGIVSTVILAMLLLAIILGYR